MLSTYLFPRSQVLVLSRELHIRDLAARILAGKLAEESATGDPTVLYRASLAEAEARLDGDL